MRLSITDPPEVPELSGDCPVLAKGCLVVADAIGTTSVDPIYGWWCSECEWGICSSECAVAAADVHHAATQWRQCTKEQPVRTWVAVCGQPAFVAMPALELRKLLFDKSKSRRRICASVYNYATTKWDPQRAQVNDIYIENKKQRAERKRLALSNYHQATRVGF